MSNDNDELGLVRAELDPTTVRTLLSQYFKNLLFNTSQCTVHTTV